MLLARAFGIIMLVRAAAPAEPESAAAAAQRYFEAEQWDEAVTALIEAYADDPDPAYLYARAQAERHRGNCRVAIELYRRYLQSHPSATQRADTERHIRLCEELLFQHSASAPADTERTAPTPEPQPAPRIRRDPVAPTLLGIGLAAAAAGLTVAILGSAARRGATEAPTEDDYEGEIRRGTALLGTGIGVAVVGAGLLAGAVARFAIISARRRARADTRASLRVDGLSLSGRF